MRSEKRNSERIDLKAPGTLSWQTPDGTSLSERILLLNLADKGILIEMSHKLELRQTVQVKIESRKIDGSASVRYCIQKGMKYRVGLEMFYQIEAKPKVQRWT